MEGDAILSVQQLQLREAAELRWDGAIELIRVKVPVRESAMTQCEQLKTNYIKNIHGL